MARHSIIIACYFASLLLCLPAYAQNKEPQWVMYGSTSDFDAFYDKSSLVKHSEGLILVIVKQVYTDKRAAEFAKQVRIHTPVKYSLGIQGFDCSMGAFRLLNTTYYSGDNHQLNSFNEDARFATPNKGSIAESLMQAICAKADSIPIAKNTPQGPQVPSKTPQKKKQKEDKDYF